MRHTRRNLALILTVCMVMMCCPVFANAAEAPAFKAGTYTATAQGNVGPVTVEVVFDDASIISVNVTEHTETQVISDPAIDRIPKAIEAGQTLAVDAVAGATFTSQAILDAVEDCALQAGADIDALKGIARRDADILVVGGGLSGLAAAISAAESGAQVLLVEKLANIGGTSATAGGGFIAVEVPVDLGFDTGIERMIPYWVETAGIGRQDAYPDLDRVRTIVAKTGETLEYLSQIGVPYGDYGERAAYASRSAVGGGAAVMAALDKAAREKGVEILVDTRAEELIVEDGAVTGVMASTDAGPLKINAKAVILATGGYAANEELLADLIPETVTVDIVHRGSPGNTGDGIRMAEAVGAAGFENYWITPATITLSIDYIHALGLTMLSGPANAGLTPATQLAFNTRGERFTSEWNASGVALNNELLYEGNAPHRFLFDSHDPAIIDALEIGVAIGEVAKGETVEDLEAALGIEPGVLRATVDTYNGYVEAGEDKAFGKPAEHLVAITEGPFYAVKMYPSGWGTMGGVQTDLDGRVLREDGSMIAGLYAVGEMSNRYYYGQGYVGGASLSIYSTLGRIAGAAAAAAVK